MNEEFEEYMMRPGDVFVSEECGCSVVVRIGPQSESIVSQSPQCCCGHTMVKRRGMVDGSIMAGRLEGDIPERPEAGVYANM